jgi:hypothetical protein
VTLCLCVAEIEREGEGLLRRAVGVLGSGTLLVNTLCWARHTVITVPPDASLPGDMTQTDAHGNTLGRSFSVYVLLSYSDW